MINDYQILGIEETDDVERIKAAFRKRAKEVHPDNKSDKDLFKNHLLFIQINQAYKRLLRDNKGSKVGKSSTTTNESFGTQLVKHKDPAYAYYKSGMTLFSKIHPSRWNKEGVLLPTHAMKIDENEKEEQKRIIKELISFFPRAYYYFSIVVNEYPESPWKYDSEEKMKVIEDRMQKYKRIILSFDEEL